jgi:DNA mismatch repair protein MutL
LLELPPQDVDVNVHPTKSEVRFKDSGRIHGLILSSVRERLLGSDLTPVAVPMRSDADDAHRVDMREKLAAFFRQMPPEIAAPAPAFPPSPRPGERVGERGLQESPLAASASPPFERPSPLRSPRDAEREKMLGAPTGPQSAPAIQLHNSYLVAQSDDGLVIIDQHALHERIMYEDLRQRLLRGPLESQRLLIPHTLPASARQVDLLNHIQPLLEKLGIEVVPFGPDTVAVQSFPSFLHKLEPADFVKELLERGEQELLDLHEEELLHEILDMMACKAAVKAGDVLSGAEIEALLSQRDLVERSSNCPHGRPTTLRLSLRDLEKQFKRTGF